MVLVRLKSNSAGTFGVLFTQNYRFYTLEPAGRPSTKSQSNTPIVCGIYQVVPHRRGALLLDVPGRSGILIHSGNTRSDTIGCILVGTERAHGRVNRSQEAVDLLRGELFLDNSINIIGKDVIYDN